MPSASTVRGPIAGLTVNAGHEYAEQPTDDFISSQLSTSSPTYKVGSGWGILNGPGSSVGDEIADICAPGPSDVSSWLVLRPLTGRESPPQVSGNGLRPVVLSSGYESWC